jgi:hypothetical protein
MADAKKETGSAKRPKKGAPPARSSLGARVVKLVASALVCLIIVWGGLYSVQVGRGPWAWSGDDWGGFVTFSRAQVAEAQAQVESVDWASLGDKITEKTRGLWDAMPVWENKLEQKLAQLRGQRTSQPVNAEGQPNAAPTATSTAPPASVEPAAKTDLEVGCEAMRDGIRHYRRSMNDQGELRAAKAKFRTAYTHLEKAYNEAEAKGEQAQVAEIEGYLMQCNTYLEDCSKREELRH